MGFCESLKKRIGKAVCCQSYDEILDEGILKSSTIPDDIKLIHSVLRTGDLFKDHITRETEKIGLTPANINILWVLYLSDGDYLTQAQLSKRLISSKANVSTIIERMQKQGLVLKESDKVNKKINKITITEEGISKLKGFFPTLKPQAAKIFKGMTKIEKESMIKSLQIIRENLR